VNLTNLARSYVRTVVPVVVGLVVSLALRAGVDLNGWTPEITAAVTFLYYALARYLEEHVSGQFGWLLGSATPPHYPVHVAKPKRHKGRDNGVTGVGILLAVVIIGVAIVLAGNFGPWFWLLLVLAVLAAALL
jgi:hypothetical protein